MSDTLETSDFHYAGAWQPINDAQLAVEGAYIFVVPAFANFKVGSDTGQSVALSGWGGFYDGSPVLPVSTAVLRYQSDGHMTIDHRLFGVNDQNNGSWGPVVADFNRDGRDDILFVSHNESPGQLRHSVAYMSHAADGYQKIQLADAVQAHQAELVNIEGELGVLVTTLGQGIWIYRYDQKANDFSFRQINEQSLANGTAGAIADLTGQGDHYLLSGGFIDFSEYSDYPGPLPGSLGVFALDDPLNVSPTPLAEYPTYFANDPLVSPDIPDRELGVLHPRVWIDDINQDGLPDVVSISGVFGPWAKSVLQLHQNAGDARLVDVTDRLNPDFNRLSNPDYNLQMVDLDNSGIASYLAGAASLGNHPSENGNYLLLNDGTGRLHIALHDEFVQWGEMVKTYLDQQADISVVQGLNNEDITPNFRGYLTEDGKLNYVASIEGNLQGVDASDSDARMLYVSLNTRIDITEFFTRGIEIGDRNGSMNIRTFAGNDTIADVQSASITTIDGGLGLDTAVYAVSLSNIRIESADQGQFMVTRGVGNASQTDWLLNMERLQLTDTSIALDINGHGGQAYRIYQAAFDRAPDLPGLGFWIWSLDIGSTLTDVARGFVNSAEFRTIYGQAPSNADVIRLFYENVLDRPPEEQGYQFWLDAMDRGLTKEQLLVEFSESPENQANLAPDMINGIEYTAFLG